LIILSQIFHRCQKTDIILIYMALHRVWTSMETCINSFDWVNYAYALVHCQCLVASFLYRAGGDQKLPFCLFFREHGLHEKFCEPLCQLLL
jgi:hypothetical protein